MMGRGEREGQKAEQGLYLNDKFTAISFFQGTFEKNFIFYFCCDLSYFESYTSKNQLNDA